MKLKSNPLKIFFSILAFCGIAGIFFPSSSAAQRGYTIEPIPDLWYNSVDGFRVGARILGYVPGTFGDGPHRLDAGVWVGTKWPEHPFSYYFSLTEPLYSLSDFGSEANIAFESIYRTGFQQHGVSFNKRWQTGFEEMNYKEFSLGFRAEHRFDEDYLLYPQLWQDEWLFLLFADFNITDQNAPGRYMFSVRTDVNLAGGHDAFVRGEISFLQKWVISDYFTAYGRFFTGVASDVTAPAYLFSRSLEAARFWMDSGLTRARGTIPPAWIEAGVIQVTGGPNVRGYLNQDIAILNNGNLPLYTSFSAVNLEFDYPNPLDRAFNSISVIGEFINLRSYLFFDAGSRPGEVIMADAGPGFMFSINIPDKLGKNRELVVRYDIPLWLSHPAGEKSFAYRNVIGIGAVISL